MAVAQEVEKSSTKEKVSGSIPVSPRPHAEVFLGRSLYPSLPLPFLQCMIVTAALYEWLNVICTVEAIWVVNQARKALYEYNPLSDYGSG